MVCVISVLCNWFYFIHTTTGLNNYNNYITSNKYNMCNVHILANVKTPTYQPYIELLLLILNKLIVLNLIPEYRDEINPLDYIQSNLKAHSINSFRPISLSLVLCKVVEHWISYLNSLKLLHSFTNFIFRLFPHRILHFLTPFDTTNIRSTATSLPQGSCLSPILFNIDICFIVKCLNASGYRFSRLQCHGTTINGYTIPYILNHTYLGLNMDPKLRWSPQSSHTWFNYFCHPLVKLF